MVRKLLKRFGWQIPFGVVAVLNFFGWPLFPQTWKETTRRLFPLDVWLVNHTPSITLTIILTSLFLGLVVIPDSWELIRYLRKRRIKILLRKQELYLYELAYLMANKIPIAIRHPDYLIGQPEAENHIHLMEAVQRGSLKGERTTIGILIPIDSFEDYARNMNDHEVVLFANKWRHYVT